MSSETVEISKSILRTLLDDIRDYSEIAEDSEWIVNDLSIREAANLIGYHYCRSEQIHPDEARAYLKSIGERSEGFMMTAMQSRCICGWRGPIRTYVYPEGVNPADYTRRANEAGHSTPIEQAKGDGVRHRALHLGE